MDNISKKDRKVFEGIADTGISQTLRSLSKITGRDWHIFSKRMEFHTLQDVWKLFPNDDSIKFGGELVYKGEIPMSFLSIFPQKSVINLTHYINEQANLEEQNIDALQKMTIAEVSNILTNSFLSIIANTLKMSMLIATPSVSVGSREYLLKKAVSKAELKSGFVLTSKLLMQSDNLTMTALFAVVLSNNSFKVLVEKISNIAQTQDFEVF